MLQTLGTNEVYIHIFSISTSWRIALIPMMMCVFIFWDENLPTISFSVNHESTMSRQLQKKNQHKSRNASKIWSRTMSWSIENVSGLIAQPFLQDMCGLHMLKVAHQVAQTEPFAQLTRLIWFNPENLPQLLVPTALYYWRYISIACFFYRWFVHPSPYLIHFWLPMLQQDSPEFGSIPFQLDSTKNVSESVWLYFGPSFLPLWRRPCSICKCGGPLCALAPTVPRFRFTPRMSLMTQESEE